MSLQFSWLERPHSGADQESAPWYINLMQGVAGWLASWFLLGFFAAAFTWLFKLDNPLVLASLGAALCGVAFLGLNRLPGVFIGQACFALSLTGQLMFAWAVFDWDFASFKSPQPYLMLAAFQGILAVTIPQFLHRVVSSWFSIIALFIALDLMGLFGLGAAVVAMLFTWIWVKEEQWGHWKKLWEPIGFGLALALIQFNSQLLFPRDLFDFFAVDPVVWWVTASNWIISGVLILAFFQLLFWQLNKQNIPLSSRIGLYAVVGICVAVLTGLLATGSSSALLILLIGFASQRKTLMGLGVVALIVFLSWYYYNLEQTLLFKSCLLIVLGLILFAGFYLLKREHEKPSINSEGFDSNATNLSEEKRMFSSAGICAVVTVALTLILVNYSIYSKETLLVEGKQVFLELAPLDPRSIMQGDYMNLNFAVTRQLRNKLNKKIDDGYLILNLNEKGVGTFDRVTRKLEPVAENQALMRFRKRNWRVQFATSAFFFQEGQASTYENAEYGEFRVDEKGEVVLNSLRDKDLKVLGYHRP